MRAVKMSGLHSVGIVEVDNELHALQTEVGGCIEVIALGDDMAMVIDDEGKLKASAYNQPATKLFRQACCTSDSIVGAALVVGLAGADFTDLSAIQIGILVTEYGVSFGGLGKNSGS